MHHRVEAEGSEKTEETGWKKQGQGRSGIPTVEFALQGIEPLDLPELKGVESKMGGVRKSTWPCLQGKRGQ